MQFLPGNIYHLFNQGNNRQTIYLDKHDYLTFLKIYKRLFENAASTIAWCLMPNHFHFMVQAKQSCAIKIKQGGILIDPLTNSIRKLLSSYARIFNDRYRRSGSLFRQKTKSKCLTDVQVFPGSLHSVQEYYVNCFQYIHQNPLKAKLVDRLENWEFSSFKDYAGLRNGTLCSKELASLYCSFNPEDFLLRSYELIQDDVIEQIK